MWISLFPMNMQFEPGWSERWSQVQLPGLRHNPGVGGNHGHPMAQNTSAGRWGESLNPRSKPLTDSVRWRHFPTSSSKPINDDWEFVHFSVQVCRHDLILMCFFCVIVRCSCLTFQFLCSPIGNVPRLLQRNYLRLQFADHSSWIPCLHSYVSSCIYYLLFVCFFVRLFVCELACLLVCLLVCLFACLPCACSSCLSVINLFIICLLAGWSVCPFVCLVYFVYLSSLSSFDPCGFCIVIVIGHSRSSRSLYHISIALRCSLHLHICLLIHWRGRCHVWGIVLQGQLPPQFGLSRFARLGVWRWHAVPKSSEHLQRCRVLDVGLYCNFTKISSSYVFRYFLQVPSCHNSHGSGKG